MLKRGGEKLTVRKLFEQEVREKKRTASGVRGMRTNRYIHTLKTPSSYLSGKALREYTKPSKVEVYNMKEYLQAEELGLVLYKLKPHLTDRGIKIKEVLNLLNWNELRFLPVATIKFIYNQEIRQNINLYAAHWGVKKQQIVDLLSLARRKTERGLIYMYQPNTIVSWAKRANIDIENEDVQTKLAEYGAFKGLRSAGKTDIKKEVLPQKEAFIKKDTASITPIEEKRATPVNSTTGKPKISQFDNVSFNITSSDKDSCLEYVLAVLDMIDGKFNIDIKVSAE
jgi:hypothetical protein